MKNGVNSKCPCGSGKKYKNCCKAKDDGLRQLFHKISNNEIPFGARVTSTSGEAASLEILKVTITQSGKTTVLLDDKLMISTNAVPGEKTKLSAASISIPANGQSDGSISTIGNASITNQSAPPKISLASDVKKIKTKSNKGAFVVVRTAMHRDTGLEYFDFLFGIRGQSEEIDESGQKPRPHIAIHPDGNGKFLRLYGHDCTIESNIGYSIESRKIYPKQLRIKSIELNETIEASFVTKDSGEIVLEHVKFST